ncbi:MAG: PAS domain S-box protein [Methanolinea sp.]|nr:PAS domain S-box protein [Methanolinea sp.]
MTKGPPTEKIERIKKLLSENPQGLCINEVAGLLKRHRNSVSRDLHALLVAGQVEAHSFGTTRVFTLAEREGEVSPLDYVRDMVILVDGEGTVMNANAPLISFLGCRREDVCGHNVREFPHLSRLLYRSPGDAGPERSRDICIAQTRDGQSVSLKIKKVPALLENGERGELALIEDCTEVLFLRGHLDSERQVLEAVAHAPSLFMVHFLPTGQTLSGSDCYASRFFPTVPSLLETNFYDLLNHEDANRVQSCLFSLSHEKPSFSLTLMTGASPGGACGIEWAFYAIFDRDFHLLSIVATGVDISPQVKAQEHQAEKERCEAILTRALCNFLDERHDDQVYAHIARDIATLIPGASVAVCSINHETQTWCIKAVWSGEYPGDHSFISGGDLVGKEFSQKNGETCFSIPDGIPPGGMTWLPHSLSRRLVECLQTGEIPPHEFSPGDPPCCAGITWGGTLHGAVGIFAPREVIREEKDYLADYLKLAALSLRERLSLHTREAAIELFQKVAAISSHPIAIIDGAGKYHYVSPRFTELFGYTLEDIPNGRTWFMKAFPDLSLQREAKTLWKKDLASSTPGQIRPRQFPVRCKDGFFKDISFLPVTLSNGDQLVVYEDLTHLHESIQTKNFLFNLFMSSHDGIFSTSTDGRVISWNPATTRIYGYTFEEMQGKDLQVLEPSYRAGEIHRIQKRALDGEYIVEFETQRVRKDGRTIDVSLTVSPVMGADGRIVGISTTVRDITQKKAEERLRKTEVQYKDLVSSINVGAYRSTGDPEGRFIWGNQSLFEMLGFSSLEELQGVAVSSLFAKEGGRAELLDELRRNGFVKNREVVLRKQDGETLQVLVTALAMFHPDGSLSFITGIVEDITYLRSLEKSCIIRKERGKDQ